MKVVKLARLCGVQFVEWKKKDGSQGAMYRLFFDYTDDAINGIGTASTVMYPERFIAEQLKVNHEYLVVLENGQCDYAGRVPVPAAK